MQIKPIKFSPLVFPKIWGGNRIAALKKLDDAPKNIGESFEVSALPNEETFEREGDDPRQPLSAIVRKYGPRLLGDKIYAQYGTEFPLLVKIIDADEALSIQVHPDDVMAKRKGMPYGKTEMWYVIQTERDSQLLNGFNRDVQPDNFENMLADGSLMDTLNKYETHEGDSFYIPAGRIHSIGAGNMLIEVQQSSGATYRVYDFDRRDDKGNSRELHIQESEEALDFHATQDGRIHYENKSLRNQAVLVKKSEYFTARVYRLDRPFVQNYENLDSFVILVAWQGAATLTDGAGNKTRLAAGESVLLPAENKSLEIVPEAGQPEFCCFETFIER